MKQPPAITDAPSNTSTSTVCADSTNAPLLFNDQKIAYLQMLQEPISRMSTTSAVFKGFAATIVAGIAALTYADIHTWVLGMSFIPILSFAMLDVYYLKLEKKYRYLYEQVRTDQHPVDFSMNFIIYCPISPVNGNTPDPRPNTKTPWIAGLQKLRWDLL